MITAISNAFTHGGIWMYAILAVHIVSIAIILERIFFLYIRRSANQKKLASQFENDIRKGQLEQAIYKAQNMAQSQPLGVVAQAGLMSAQHLGGKEEIH